MSDPIVIIGGFLSNPGFYSEMARSLSALSGQPVYVCEIGWIDWLRARSAKGWLNILLKVRSKAIKAMESGGSRKIVLIGHSSGGIIGRMYLSPQPFLGFTFNGVEHVSHLVTLGSPHYGGAHSPMRTYVQDSYPDSFFSNEVVYVSVAGTAVDLRTKYSLSRLLTLISYRHFMGGKGKVVGDGLVPNECALLKESRHIVLQDVGHPFLLATNWYGKTENVSAWWGQIFSSLQ
jgi:pimeloyl-ACP methyl ester carboxylesterase